MIACVTMNTTLTELQSRINIVNTINQEPECRLDLSDKGDKQSEITRSLRKLNDSNLNRPLTNQNVRIRNVITELIF